MSICRYLYGLCVYRIVLAVSANEAHVHNAEVVVDPCHQPILVAGDIENHPSVLQHASRAESRFDVPRCAPIRSPNKPVSGEHRLLRIAIRRMLFGSQFAYENVKIGF
jgi:hypothetical protein